MNGCERVHHITSLLFVFFFASNDLINFYLHFSFLSWEPIQLKRFQIVACNSVVIKELIKQLLVSISFNVQPAVFATCLRLGVSNWVYNHDNHVVYGDGIWTCDLSTSIP